MSETKDLKLLCLKCFQKTGDYNVYSSTDFDAIMKWLLCHTQHGRVLAGVETE